MILRWSLVRYHVLDGSNTIMIKIAILRPQALRALPRIMNTEITLASSTSLGSGSTQLFTPGSWVLNNNRLQNCITLEDTVMRQRCASWTTGTTVWTSCCWPTWTTPWGWWSYCPGSRPTLCRPPIPGGQQICLQLRPCLFGIIFYSGRAEGHRPYCPQYYALYI